MDIKERTTVYLNASVKRTIKKNIRNFSAWVEDKVVLEFGSAMSLEEIDRDIFEAEKNLARLRNIRAAAITSTHAPID